MKIGILGGGQLGRMFAQAASNYPCALAFLEPQSAAPIDDLCGAVQRASFQDYQSVLSFGRGVDVLGIEIEHVDVDALAELEREGRRVIPSAETLRIIQDKGRQKTFYREQQLPTPEFYLIAGAQDLDLARLPYPFIQKARRGGYDGRGVQRIDGPQTPLWDTPSVIEAVCPIARELAVLVARDAAGQECVYPVLEMSFDPVRHQLDVVRTLLHADATTQAATQLARRAVAALGSAGVFAVELFVDTAGKLWLNEIAPRVHNSAHLTIEACASSQFDQMWRILSAQPLGSPRCLRPAAMVNLVGAEGEQGPAQLLGLKELLAMEEVFVHWYGKTTTQPGRKMGHVTLLADDETTLTQKIAAVKALAKVVAHG